MSERSVGRALLRIAALATAAVMAFGSTSVAAFAQDDPTATSAPAETSTPQETPQPTPQPTPETPSNEPPPPPATTGSVSGVLYADKNRNGRQDAEEAISGGKVVIHGGGDGSFHETTSNAVGEFAFADDQVVQPLMIATNDQFALRRQQRQQFLLRRGKALQKRGEFRFPVKRRSGGHERSPHATTGGIGGFNSAT